MNLNKIKLKDSSSFTQVTFQVLKQSHEIMATILDSSDLEDFHYRRVECCTPLRSPAALQRDSEGETSVRQAWLDEELQYYLPEFYLRLEISLTIFLH